MPVVLRTEIPEFKLLSRGKVRDVYDLGERLLIVGGQQQNNFEGDLTDRQLNLFASSTTPQFWNVSTFYLWHPALLDDISRHTSGRG